MLSRVASVSIDPEKLRLEAWVCRQNLDDFRRRLRLATDPQHQSLLTELIADEEKRLEEIEDAEAARCSDFRGAW